MSVSNNAVLRNDEPVRRRESASLREYFGEERWRFSWTIRSRWSQIPQIFRHQCARESAGDPDADNRLPSGPAVAVECPHGGGVTTHNDKTAKCSFAGAACTNALPVERQAAGASSSLLPTGSGLLTSTLG